MSKAAGRGKILTNIAPTLRMFCRNSNISVTRNLIDNHQTTQRSLSRRITDQY